MSKASWTAKRSRRAFPKGSAPADLSEADLRELLEKGNAEDQILGVHPETNDPILLKAGPYGPYVQRGEDDQPDKPKRVNFAQRYGTRRRDSRHRRGTVLKLPTKP